MIDLPEELQALLKECRVLRSRGSGPGGQHRNVCESRITLDHWPSGLHVVCDETRSQHRNLKLALEVLLERIRQLSVPRKRRVMRTQRTKGVRRRILENKKRRSQTKQLRRRVRSDD